MLYPNLGCKGIPARLRFLPLWGLLLSSASLFAQTGPILTLPTPPATVSAIGVIPNPDNNSYIQVTLSNVPPGQDIANGIYDAWCIDFLGKLRVTNANTYNSYGGVNGNPNPALPPLVLQNGQTAWYEVNWLINHKTGNANDEPGATTTEIQDAIWQLLDPFYPVDRPVPNDAVTTQLVADAMNFGASFIPGPGQFVAVLLYVDGIQGSTGSGNVQDLIIEVPVPTGRIGDYVWLDQNHNGLQDPNETGINGVTVYLYQGTTLIAITLTTPAPLNYPFSGPHPDGYYQFTGLAPGSYSIVILPGDPRLVGTSLTLPLQGSNILVDSNGQGGTVPGTATPAIVASVTLPNNDQTGIPSSIDETIDFGFYPSGPLTIICQGNSTATVNVPFNSGPETVTGGVGPYTFSIVGGLANLPAGLTLNTSTGAVTGTPTAPGSFTVAVTDSQGNVGQGCLITVYPAPIKVICQALNMATVGVPFNSGPETVTGGVGPYTFSIVGGLVNLPPGLTLNTATGAVTGTPTAAGTFAVQVTDSKGNLGQGCLITVNPPLVVICQSINVATVGVPFNSGPETVTGGSAPYTFSIVGGLANLPAGLTLNTSTGAITGIPSVIGTFSVQVTDSLGNIGQGCLIMVNPLPLTNTCQAINMAMLGIPFNSGPETVMGGVAPYTFSIVGGLANLPAGLTLNTSTGAITGTPTATGTFSVQVTDSQGNIGVACSITVTLGQDLEINYASNLSAGDAQINITNTGANGAMPNGPGIGAPAGNICVNVYTFAPDEQEISCCSCLVTPNGLVSLSVANDLIANTLTGVRPDSVVVKLLTSLAGAGGSASDCINTAAAPSPLAPGKLAWRSSVHPAPGGGFATTETPFIPATLSPAELASITNRCANIIGNGSGFGICKSCRAGGLSAGRQ